MLIKQVRFAAVIGASLCLLGVPGVGLAGTQSKPSQATTPTTPSAASLETPVTGKPTLSGQAPTGSTQPVPATPADPSSPTAPTTEPAPVNPTSPQAEPQSPTGSPSGAQETPGQSAKPTASDLSAMLTDAVNNMDTKVQELKGLGSNDVKSIRAVNVQTLLTEKSDQDTFKKALTDNKSQVKSLQSAINANSLVKDTLVTNKIPVERVVALNIVEGSNLVVFYY